MIKIMSINLSGLSVIFLLFTYFTDQSEAKSYKKWTNISMEESLLNLKNWPSDCRFRIRTAANYSSETTVGFCPSWVGSEEPRTYIMLRNPSPNIYLSGHLKDFAEHPLFTSWKGGHDSYFANPVIKSGQETKCVFDSKCWFRRVEFSVKGKQCQWVYYHPDYVPATGQLADTEVMRSATPYALEFFTCQTSIPFTKEHIQMKPGKVTVVWPGAPQINRIDKKKDTDPLSLVDDGMLCKKAVNSNNQNIWSTDQKDLTFVAEAKYRGYSVEDCTNIAEQEKSRFGTSVTEKVAAVPNLKMGASKPKANTKTVSVSPKDSKMERRPIAIQWEGKESLIAGEVEISSKGRGKISVSLPDKDASCSGTFAYTNRQAGIWTVACTSGEAASGTFKGRGSGKGSNGEGTDNNGRYVKFTIGAR